MDNSADPAVRRLLRTLNATPGTQDALVSLASDREMGAATARAVLDGFAGADHGNAGKLPGRAFARSRKTASDVLLTASGSPGWLTSSFRP